MAQLNARCDQCGTVFAAPMEVHGAKGITIRNAKTGPCPNCGSDGTPLLNNQTFDIADDKVILRNGSNLSLADLALAITPLATFPKSDRSRKATEQAIVKAIPELAPEVKGQGWSRDDLWNIIQIILAFFQIWQTQAQPEGVTSAQMNTLIQEIRSLKTSPGPEHHLRQAPPKDHPANRKDEPDGHH